MDQSLSNTPHLPQAIVEPVGAGRATVVAVDAAATAMPGSVGVIAPAALLARLRAQAGVAAGARSLVVYDVRDSDRGGGHLAGSAHAPADAFLRSADAAAASLSAPPVDTVAFHCTFSQVRGPRCAARFADALARKGVEGVAVVVVEGGFKALAQLQSEWKDCFEDFDPGVHREYWD